MTDLDIEGDEYRLRLVIWITKSKRIAIGLRAAGFWLPRQVPGRRLHLVGRSEDESDWCSLAQPGRIRRRTARRARKARDAKIIGDATLARASHRHQAALLSVPESELDSSREVAAASRPGAGFPRVPSRLRRGA
jgi:hypothetical protein